MVNVTTPLPGFSSTELERTPYRYASLYDMGEIDEIGACFTVDAVVEFGASVAVGRQAVVAHLRRQRARYSSGHLPWHTILNAVAHEQSDGTATVTSWFTFAVEFPDGPPQIKSVGCYEDLLCREDGHWRVKRRRLSHPGDA